MCGDTGVAINPGPRTECIYCKISIETSYSICSLCVNNLPSSLADDLVNNANDIQLTSLIQPSEMPDNQFDCFKRRGLHFIHINARSMFHKLTEIKVLALKIKPAVISISESWLDESVIDLSVKIPNYNIIR